MSLHATFTSDWGQNVEIGFFLKMVMLQIKLKRMTHTIFCSNNFVLTGTLDPWGQKVTMIVFFSESSHFACQMNRKVGHAHTMVIYTMDGLGEWCFLQTGRGLKYCIAIRHALVFMKVVMLHT